MRTLDFYPWQKETAQSFLAQNEKLAHAYLLYGQAGIGKSHFALSLAKTLLCQQLGHSLTPCHQCAACHWMDLGHHPDIKCIVPDSLAKEFNIEPFDLKENLSKEIRVEQVRMIEPFVQLSAHQEDGLKIVLIYPVEKMNPISANALLKILEEPPKQTLFLLVSHQIRSLLPTIISRCRLFHLPNPHESEAISWLIEQGIEKNKAIYYLNQNSGSVLTAFQQAQEGDTGWLEVFLKHTLSDVSKGIFPNMEETLETLKEVTLLDFMQGIQKTIVDIALVQKNLPPKYFPQYQPVFKTLSNRLKGDRLFVLNQFITEKKQFISHPLNTSVFMQTILQRYFLLLGASPLKT